MEACKICIVTLVSCLLLSCLSFFMICDLTYSTVICYEGGNFQLIKTMISSFTLNYLFSLIIYYEGCKFPVIVSCASLSYLWFFMISVLTYSTAIFYEACKFSNADICVCLSYLTFYNHIPLWSAMKRVSFQTSTKWFHVCFWVIFLSLWYLI